MKSSKFKVQSPKSVTDEMHEGVCEFALNDFGLWTLDFGL
jgi:hypothetical protein